MQPKTFDPTANLMIGGQPRSGTSLLCTLCDMHPEMIVSSELRIFDRINQSYSEHMKRLRKNWWSFPYFAVSKRKPATILRNAALVPRYSAELKHCRGGRVGLEDIRTALHAVFPDARVIGDKFPPYVWKFPELADRDRLHRVVIYRDPRDVVQSTLKMVGTEWRGRDFAQNLDTAEKIADKWTRSMQLVRRYPEGLFIIRYEDLVTDPHAALEPLGRWLGVDPAGFPFDLVTPSSIGKYRDELTREQIDTILRIAGPTMEALGYE